jgi:hypothetical protein
MFFTQKLISNSFLTQNTIETLLYQSLASKNARNQLENQNQLETKNQNLFELKSIFLSILKVKKHLILTSLIILNNLTQESTVLVTKIVVNDNFLSIH